MFAGSHPLTRPQRWRSNQTTRRISGNRLQRYLYERVRALGCGGRRKNPGRGGGRTFGLLLLKIVHVVRSNLVEEFDIVVRMKLCHFPLGGRLCALSVEMVRKGVADGGCVSGWTYVYLHLLVKTIVHDQRMGHSDTRRLHPA